MSTLNYGDDRLAMYIDSVQRARRVTGDRVLNEAASWGLSRLRAAEIIADVLDRMRAAVDSARAETPGLPPEIPAIIDAQLEQVRSAFGSRSA